MIVKQLTEIIGTENDVHTATWNSRRLILSGDKVGFSLHDTLIRAGSETEIWYKHHIEAVYCIEGEGEIETVTDGKIYPIRPGTLYVLDGHENHFLRGKTTMRMICVFNPPCTGKEVHGKDGSYPLNLE